MGIQKIGKSQLDRKEIIQSVLEEIGEFKGPINLIEQQKLQCIGHIMQYSCIEYDSSTGKISGKRSRG